MGDKQKSIEEKILIDIHKTGFATELNVVSSLIKMGWSAEHARTYEDKDENRSREIDVIASKVFYDISLGFRLTFSLVIEVKKSERPWIIFTTTPSLRPELGWRVLHRCGNVYEWFLLDNSSNQGYHAPVFKFDSISRNSLRSNTTRVGKAFHELEKKPGDTSKIYEALISTCKAAYYQNGLFTNEEISLFDLDKEVDIEIVLPIVIVDGLLFEVFNDDDGQMKVLESGYVPVELPYSSPHYRDNKFDLTFYPDIIRFSYLDEFLKSIDGWKQAMREGMISDLKAKGKRPDKSYLELVRE